MNTINIVKKIDQYNENNLYFCEPIKNNIMSDGKFIRILYSTQHFILNGIYLFIPLNEILIEKYFNKFKCSFHAADYKEMIEDIHKIEDSILKKVNISNKIPLFKIYEQLKNGNIKIFTNDINIMTATKSFNNSFYLKISGVWETDMHYGLTYKFSKINRQ